jgi:hypothetical protein
MNTSHTIQDKKNLPRITTSSTCSTSTSDSNKEIKKKRQMSDCKNDIIKKLHTCAKAGKPQQARQFLKQMQALYEQGDKDMRPDFRHYNSMMHAWVKSNTLDKEFQAQSILEWMCDLQKNTPPGIEHTHLKPTNISFNICINAWSKSCEKHSTNVAWYLFDLMQSMKEEGHISDGPDYHTCKVIIHALSNKVEKGTVRKAERVLQLMHDSSNCKPDASIYNQIMHIYSHNKERNAPQKGEALMTDMHGRYLAGDESLKPTTLTFNTLLNTYAKSKSDGAADRAEMILQHMQELHGSGHEFVQPDVISFNTVINAHASSHKEGADRRAYNILSKMKKLHAVGHVAAVPNVRTYNACMKACLCSCSDMDGNTAEKETSMALACNLLSQMRNENVCADEHTYHWFFKACQNLCADDLSLHSRLHWAYWLCYNSGILNDRLHQQIQQITTNAHSFQAHLSRAPPPVPHGLSPEGVVNGSASRNQETDCYSWAHASSRAYQLNDFEGPMQSQSLPQRQPMSCIPSSNDSTISSSLCSHDDSIDFGGVFFQETLFSSQATPRPPVSLPSVISVDGSTNMWAYESHSRQPLSTIDDTKKWTSRVEDSKQMSIPHTIPE